MTNGFLLISLYFFFIRYLNNEQLKTSDTVLTATNADKNDYIPSLKLSKLMLLNVGQVKVHAKNSEGEASCTANLGVNGNFFL